MTSIPKLAALAAAMAFALAAHADINVGVMVSTTGPGATLGIPEANTTRLWPTEIAGQKLNVTILNDESDTTTAAKNATKLTSENKVDVIVGPSLTPTSLSALDIAAQARTPMISLAGGGAIIDPPDGPRRWAFRMAPPESIAVSLALDHMVAQGVKKVGVIALATSFGEGYTKTLEKMAPAKGIQVVAVERYNQTDTSVTSQTLRLLSAQPDAVYVMSSGTPGALPPIELSKRGFKGSIYQTQGVANADFLRVGGKGVEGGYMTVGPVLVAEQLPDSSVLKKPALDYVKRYEAANGTGSRSLFGASAWTAVMWLEAAVPQALKKAKPGTVEFRTALRDALESMKEVVTPEAVFSMSETNHNGSDQRSQVLVRIVDGAWKLQK
ncbi:leucine ABC transporter subunit substrate-binding protein LivK [Variovorax sp. SRS16]|uniref:ABC transporter substrate-binding protein n=1 Tax=Variovorax sp. SRS16 TaxID=282217 RepID=UPI0013191702|nr:ABC transporter substrate-binding protein [Variovorax sp. SRS16]VTU24426.1 leucine ABC transporter subunit substrate-binding protein LivK [Variovorax sp. SRS16]